MNNEDVIIIYNGKIVVTTSDNEYLSSDTLYLVENQGEDIPEDKVRSLLK